MRTRHTAAALTAAAVLTLTATACSSDDATVSTKPDKTSAATTTAAPASTKPKPAPKPSPKAAGVGDTISLQGFEGVKFAVTLVKVDRAPKSSNEYIQPDKGKKWVAVQLKITNTGTEVYDDSPDNCGQAADTQGQRYSSQYVDSLAAGPSFPSLNLPPGEKALGWVTFEVPKSARITTIQYTADSGMGNSTAQWTIK